MNLLDVLRCCEDVVGEFSTWVLWQGVCKEEISLIPLYLFQTKSSEERVLLYSNLFFGAVEMTQRTLILPLLLSYLRIGCFLLLFMVSFLCFFSCFPPTFSLYSLFPLFTLLSTRFFFVLSLSYLSVTFFYNFPPLRPLSSSPCCIS